MFAGWVRSASAEADLAAEIKQRVAELAVAGRNRIGREAIVAAEFLNTFYKARGYRPAWREPANFSDLRNQILESRRDGLDIDDFHAHALGFGGLDFWPPAMTDAERDILKSSALVNLLYQLYFGKVTPESLDPHWNLKRQAPLPLGDAARAISTALDSRAVKALIAQARGDDPAYTRLRNTLAAYRAIAERGGWPIVPAGAVIKPGMKDPRIAIVRRRLTATGDYVAKGLPLDDTYDPALVDAVMVFQRRHGIDVDGIIGPAVIGAMAATAQQRVDQIRVNLERARWIARTLRRKQDLVVVKLRVIICSPCSMENWLGRQMSLPASPITRHRSLPIAFATSSSIRHGPYREGFCATKFSPRCARIRVIWRPKVMT